MKQKTLKKSVQYTGIGLHKGENIKMKLIPTDILGIVFKRVDLENGKNIINLDINNTFELTRGTNIKNKFGASVYTVEHFLSALSMLGITNLIVELDGNELPIGDGSAIAFLKLIETDNIRELDNEIKEIVIKKPLYIQHQDKYIVGLPFDGFKITYTIKFNHTFLKTQMYEITLTKQSYEDEISCARTFGFDYEVEYLKKNNLALGGSLDNAIVIQKDGILNASGLRFEDEFVRHKILDLIGDLKVLNFPIKGHIIAIKAGHALDIEFAKLLKKQEEI